MHAIENELIKATDFKPRKKYADRQEYLKAVLNSVSKLSDDEFFNLSDDATKWTDACIKIINGSRNGEVPDFDEVDPSAEPGDDGEDEAVDPETGEVMEASNMGETEPDPEPEDDDETESEPDEDEGDPTDDNDEDVLRSEAEEAPKAKKKKKPAPGKTPVPKDRKDPKPKPPTPAQAKRLAAAEKTRKVKPTTPKVSKLNRDSDEDVVLDKWGCMEGSKNSQALALFEKGATTKEVKEAIGGTYYNILGKMEQAGHKLSKEGHVMTLTYVAKKK